MPDSATKATSWPQPRHLWAATCAWSLFVVYGSLTPFHFRPLAWDQASQIVRWIIDQPLVITSRGDWVTNVLLLVPFGVTALGALLVDRSHDQRRWIGIGVVLALGLLLSLFVETAQLWFPPRYPSKTDVLAQTIGNSLGMGTWILIGQPLIDWLRRAAAGGPAGRAAMLLQVYAAGLLMFSLLPLDLTIRLGELWAKYKEGRIVLIPFANWKWDAATFTAALLDAAALWPIGILAALWTPRSGGSSRQVFLRWLAAIGFVCLIEFCQLFVKSRYSDATDLIIGAIGVSGGFAVALWWTASRGQRSWSGRLLPAACLLAVALLLLATFLTPFDYVPDHRHAAEQLRAMFRVPLEILRQGEPLAMVTNVLRKLVLFGVFGWLTGETARALFSAKRDSRSLTVCGALAGLLFAAAIEISQAWFPPHVPELTDILWGGLGGGLGAYLGLMVSDDPQIGSTM